MNRGSFHGSWPYSQPPSGYPIEINWNDPQAKGLAACWMPAAGPGVFPLRDLVSGRYPMTAVNSPTWVGDGEMGPSVLLDDGANEYLRSPLPAALGYPVTMSCWFKSNDATIDQCLVGISSESNAFEGLWMIAYGASAGDYIRARGYDGGNAANAITTAGFSAGVWEHVTAVFASPTDRRVFIRGRNKGVDTNYLNAPDQDNTTIGAIYYAPGPAVDFPFSGLISNVCIWNRALTDSEVYEQFRDPWDLVQMPRKVWALTPPGGAVGFPWPGPRHPSKNINLRL